MAQAGERREEILGEWLDLRDAGERVAHEEVIAAHPDLAVELRRRFRALSLMVDAMGDEAGRPTLRALPSDRHGEFQVLPVPFPFGVQGGRKRGVGVARCQASG